MLRHRVNRAAGALAAVLALILVLNLAAANLALAQDAVPGGRQ
jgi:hypothetical protein